MEKRLLLAFVLSFSILYLWSALFVKKPINNAQIFDNKQLVSEKVDIKIEPIKNNPPISAEKSTQPEKLEKIETDKFKVDFSYLGGYLKTIHLKEYNYSLPVSNILKIKNFEDKEFILLRSSSENVVFQYEDNIYKVTKSYNFSKGYDLNAQVSIVNKSDIGQNINVQTEAIKLEMSRVDIHSFEKSNYEYVLYSGKNFIRKHNAFKFEEKERIDALGRVDWLAFRDRYFCLIIKPEYVTTNYSLNPLNSTEFGLNIESKGVQISRGGSIDFDYKIYAGPENIAILENADKDFVKIKMFYKLGIFDFVAHFLYNALHFSYKIFHNWGVSIILICGLIYLAMYPLTINSMASMKKMQALQPKMNEIREKYKNNQQKQSTELMQLYKDNKINPLGGCLPILLQMPFFLGIYQVLWRDVSFKGANFLWIKDLTLPDRLIIFPFNIPFVGNEFNVLPILYAIAMFFQQKFSSRNMVAADPSQAEVQKMMVVFMPIMLAVMFYKFPSGITLYFTTFFLLTAFSQWKMAKS